MPVIKIIDKLDRHPEFPVGPWSLDQQSDTDEYCLIAADSEWAIALRMSDKLTSAYQKAIGRRIVACINACTDIPTADLERWGVSLLEKLCEDAATQRETQQHTLAAIAKEIELAGYQVGGPAGELDPDADLNPRTARTLIARATERFAAIGAIIAAHKG